MFNVIIFTDFTDTVLVQKTLGAYKIAHELRCHGYSCLVIDHFHAYDIEEVKQVLDIAMGSQTLAVGFSTTFFQKINPPDSSGRVDYSFLNLSESFCPQGAEFENALVAYIKQKNPTCRLILGGTKTQQEVKNRNIDFSIIGHGEISVPNLIDHIRDGRKLDHSYRNLWGVTVIQDAESKNYDFANGHMSWEDIDIINAKVLPLESARGCVFNCRFCGYPMRGKKNLDFVRKADSIRKELQYNYDRYGIDTYSFMDDTFNDSEQKLDQILDAVQGLTFKPKFWCYARLDLLSVKPERLTKMHEIGVRSMFLGIETLNERTGRIIGKGYSRAKQIETVKRIRKDWGDEILLHGSFIIGLPEEDANSVTRSFRLLMDQEMPLHSFRFGALRIARNRKVWPSDFELDYEKYGYVDQDPTLPLEIDWKNGIMTRQQAQELAVKFHAEAENSDRYYVPSQTAWSLLNYGYDLKELCMTKNSRLDWHRITQQKHVFISEYKSRLLSLLKTQE